MDQRLTRDQDTRATFALLLGICLFALLSLPFLSSPFNQHPDERRYTFAAAEMIASGNYLVPISETGEVRLKKPPLTYYYVVAGFKTFGEGMIGAKILMVLSATAIIALAYSLCRSLGVDRQRALLGAGIVGGHRIFFSTSNQHLPDMPLVLGVTVALIGFVRIFKDSAPPVWAYYAAWLGVAYALLAKGMLVLLLVALVVAMRFVLRTGQPFNRHETIALSLFVFVSGLWFVPVLLQYPTEFFAQFLGDQVTDKAAFDPMQVLRRIPKTTSDLILSALPLLVGIGVAVFMAWRSEKLSVRIGFKRPPNEVVFLVLWCVINILVFAFSSKLYERYILPALPALAALVAYWVRSVPISTLTSGLKVSFWIFGLLPIVAFALSAVLLLRIGDTGWGTIVVLAALVYAGVLWLTLRKSSFAGAVGGLAAIFPLLALAVLPLQATIAFPTAGRLAAAAGGNSMQTRMVLDDAKLLDDIGLQTGGLARYSFSKEWTATDEDLPDWVYFLNTRHAASVAAAGYDIELFWIFRDSDVNFDDILTLLRTGQRAEFVERHGEILHIARRTSR